MRKLLLSACLISVCWTNPTTAMENCRSNSLIDYDNISNYKKIVYLNPHDVNELNNHEAFPNLEVLYVSRWNLDDLLQEKNFSALKELSIDGESFESMCVKLGNLPLEFKELIWNKLGTLPKSIRQLTNLESLTIRIPNCRTPYDWGQVQHLKNLKHLHFDCPNLVLDEEVIKLFENLEELTLENYAMDLPESLGKLKNLHKLSFKGSSALTSIPESIGDLQNLEILDLSMCSGLTSLPKSIGNLKDLKLLFLEGCSSLSSLPKSINNLKNLKIWHPEDLF